LEEIWNREIEILASTEPWRLECYAGSEPVGNLLPTNQQVHRLFPGGDLRITENIVWNFGVGIGLTEAGSGLVYKTRIGILFGGKQN